MLAKSLTAGLYLASLVSLPETQAREGILESLRVETPFVQRLRDGIDLRCTSTVDRLKRGPADYKSIIERGLRGRRKTRGYTDRDFYGVDQYYKLPWSGWSAWEDYWMYGFNYYFQRLGEKYPDATLFGTDGVPKFSDVEG